MKTCGKQLREVFLIQRSFIIIQIPDNFMIGRYRKLHTFLFIRVVASCIQIVLKIGIIFCKVVSYELTK